MIDVLTLRPSTVHDVSVPRESFQTAAARHEPVSWRDGKMAAAIRRLMRLYLLSSMTTDVSIPSGTRWIPQGMTVKYLAKAKTDLKVVCDAANTDFSKTGEVTVHVDAFDTEGTQCFTADIIMNVKLG